MGWGEHDEHERLKPSERERRLERALRLARGILAGTTQMTKDALTVIDNALKRDGREDH